MSLVATIKDNFCVSKEKQGNQPTETETTMGGSKGAGGMTVAGQRHQDFLLGVGWWLVLETEGTCPLETETAL